MKKLILKEVVFSILQSIIWIVVIYVSWRYILTFHRPRKMSGFENHYTFLFVEFLWIAYCVLLLIINLITIKFNSLKSKIALHFLLFATAFIFIGQSFDVTPNKVKLFVFTCLVTSLSKIPMELLYRYFTKKSVRH
jgi:hypothetical protein